MKSKITFALLFCSLVFHAQDPAIEWQQTIGGTSADILNSFEPTPDGGSIIAGYSLSGIGGDKTEDAFGGQDIWIVKLDADGNIQWQNSIGGSAEDFVNAVKPTSDGGYIVFAGSDSSISGDKTEDSRGGLDFWILKLDAMGDIVWQRTYGGSQPDFDTYGEETSDGGFIVGGYSDSGISGDKTEASNGQRDFWVLKLTSMGDIEWQNSIGGDMVDRLQAIVEISDGYIAGGFSTSGISGDKTETSRGSSDYWIVKLSQAGEIIWDKTFGGNDSDALRDLIATSDGGILAGGYSLSNISGDKNENSQGNYDYWMVKFTSSGTLSWQNTIGGNALDYLRDIKELTDGSIMVAGYSQSAASGDKLEAGNGGFDYWLLKLSETGDILSQKCIGGAGDESGPYIYPTADNGYKMACSSTSGVSGDKSDASVGAEDYWIFKVSSEILGISDPGPLQVNIFPNPTKGDLSITIPDAAHSVSAIVYNILGQEIFSSEYTVADINLTLNGPAGIYFVRIHAGGFENVFRIVKE